MKLLFVIPLIGILLLTLLLGSRMIIAQDFFFLADQARDFLLVQDIVVNKNITLIGTHSGLGGFFHGPLWLYLLMPFYILGGGDPFAFTYAYVLIAIITVLAGFLIGNSLYGRKAGFLLALLLGVSPSIWMYIPNTIGVNVIPLVLLVLFYFLLRYLHGKQYAFIGAAFFVGLSLQFETALPLILIPIVFVSFFLNKKAITNVKVILGSLVAFVLSLATFILFEVRHNFLMTNSLITIFTSGKREQGYLEIPERLLSHLQSMRGVYESILVTRSVFLELLLVAIFIAFIVYTIKLRLYKKREWKDCLYLLLFPVCVFVLYTGYAYPVFPEYLLGLTVPVALAAVLIFRYLWRTRVGKVLVILFLGLTILETGKLLYSNYLLPYQQNMTSGSYQNQQVVARWIMNDSKGKPFGYFVYTPSTFTYGMDYLLWWEAKQAAMATPTSTKKETTYLILYPPLENDKGAHAFWKKYKIKTAGKVITRKEFTGGIIVEKLAIDPKEEPADPTYNQELLFR